MRLRAKVRVKRFRKRDPGNPLFSENFKSAERFQASLIPKFPNTVFVASGKTIPEQQETQRGSFYRFWRGTYYASKII